MVRVTEAAAIAASRLVGRGDEKAADAAAVEAMRAALKAAGKNGSDIHVYGDAAHGFHADYRPSYNEADARDGWARMLAFFRANAVA